MIRQEDHRLEATLDYIWCDLVSTITEKFFKNISEQSVLPHAFNPNTREVEAD